MSNPSDNQGTTTTPKQSPQKRTQHQQRPSKGHNRVSSAGNNNNNMNREDSIENLRKIAADLKEKEGNSSPTSRSGAGSPTRTRNNPNQQRRTSQPMLNPSTLNPQAGGFNPNSLGSISDMIDEGLVTPTASHFDLMTGMPRSSSSSGQPSQPAIQELPEGVPDYANAGRPFMFPPAALQQQQQFLALQQQQQQQLQQLQMAQMASMGIPEPLMMPPGAPNATELMAEQLAIQQQLETLRIQQQNLLAKFDSMAQQARDAVPPGPPGIPQPPFPPQNEGNAQQQAQHRRGQSQQLGGVMGSFAPGIGAYGQSFSGGSASQGKGHGRRHSANLAKPGQPQSSSQGGPPAAPSSGMGNFTFPSNRSAVSSAPTEDNSATGPGPQMGHHRRTSSSMSSMGGWSLAQAQQTQANLAEAQAHLAQLAQYRASAGHSRIPSFGMSTLGGGPGQLAMASYGGGIPTQQQSGPGVQARKSLFAPYLPQASIPPLLTAGKLVIGVLRVNKRNRSDAYVSTDVLDSDIYICGSKDRNRALEGDIVAVELLDVDEVWGTKKEKEEKKRKKEENQSFDPRAARDLRKQDKKKDDVEVEGQGLFLFEDEEVNDEQKPQFAGHVVAVVERAPGQLFSGMLGVLRPSSAATQQKQDAERRERDGGDSRPGQSNSNNPPKIVWFRPTDKRVPLIAIPTEQAPSDFISDPDKYSDRLFVACIKRWPITSLHPFGTLVEELGQIGDIETETNALLKDCNFTAEDFVESVVKCLPPLPWSIPERELQSEVRRDFRQNRVFTIDPETAKDLDDALHIVKNDDGTYEVGVHIADVSHFVKPNTALDREARKRATTVYLVQRAVPMLPPTLSEELCSLNPGSDKLTFSVVFQMDDQAKVLSTWFGKSVIRSTAKLAYSDAQAVIDNGSLPDGKIEDKEVASGVAKDVEMLASLARQMRKRRFESGALKIDRVKTSFKLNEDGLPEDCTLYERKESHELIEEFMLLANMGVAKRIAAALPEHSLLRRHESPIDRRFDAFIARMKRLGLDIDGSSSGALMRSFSTVDNPVAKLLMQHLSTRTMLRAKYFCTGTIDITKFGHYALNVPLYTHFTSPIRRYADVIVHRQLELALQTPIGSDAKFNLDTEAVAKIAQTCNTKKDAARLAQEQSAHLFLCHLLHDLTRRYGPVVRQASVIGVLDQAFDIVIPDFGLEKRVHADQMPNDNITYDEHDNSLTIYWKRGVDVLSWLAETQSDDHLNRIRKYANHHAKALDPASRSAEEEQALFDDDDADGPLPPLASTDASKTSLQHQKSQDKSKPKFEGVEETENGHCIQVVKELMQVPVVVTADLTKSPPVIKVLALNPFA